MVDHAQQLGREGVEVDLVAEAAAEPLHRPVYLLSQRLGVEMPIVEQMYKVIYEGKKPAEAVRDLMQRSLKPELS